MSDDENDRGDRDNTGREHRPKNAQHNENAPTGSLGTHHMTPSPGGGMSQKWHVTQSREQSSEPEPQKYIDPANDTRPEFHETDDKEINDFYKKTHRMIPKDAPERGTSNEGPRISQSDFAKAFRQASAKTQSMQRSRGIDHD